MIIEVHIEKLVLDGLSVTSAQGPLVQAAVEAELARRLKAERLFSRPTQPEALPAVSAGPIQLGAGPNPAGLGRQIANSLFTALSKR